MQKSKSQRVFESGAVRDSSEGKIRPDLISPYAEYRIGKLLAEAAEHYGAFNYWKGIPMSRSMESLRRHINQAAMGDNSEDHFAAIAVNAIFLLHADESVRRGLLPESLRDLNHMPDVAPIAEIDVDATMEELHERIFPGKDNPYLRKTSKVEKQSGVSLGKSTNSPFSVRTLKDLEDMFFPKISVKPTDALDTMYQDFEDILLACMGIPKSLLKPEPLVVPEMSKDSLAELERLIKEEKARPDSYKFKTFTHSTPPDTKIFTTELSKDNLDEIEKLIGNYIAYLSSKGKSLKAPAPKGKGFLSPKTEKELLDHVEGVLSAYEMDSVIEGIINAFIADEKKAKACSCNGDCKKHKRK